MLSTRDIVVKLALRQHVTDVIMVPNAPHAEDKDMRRTLERGG